MDKRKAKDGVGAGIFLIGLGVLFLTGWWWPGIMFVIGLTAMSGQIAKRQYAGMIPVTVIFFVLPIVLFTGIRWDILLPMLFIGLGLTALINGVFTQDRDDYEKATRDDLL